MSMLDDKVINGNTFEFSPSEKQRNLLRSLIEFEEYPTIVELCAEAEIAPKTYYEWQKNPDFVLWFKNEYDKATAQYIPRIKKNLYTRALSPGAKKEDIELALRVHGSYVPEQKHTVENRIEYSKEIEELKKLAEELSKIEVTPDGISERTENITG